MKEIFCSTIFINCVIWNASCLSSFSQGKPKYNTMILYSKITQKLWQRLPFGKFKTFAHVRKQFRIILFSLDNFLWENARTYFDREENKNHNGGKRNEKSTVAMETINIWKSSQFSPVNN